MSDGKTYDLIPSITDFGIKPREGFKFCLKCRATIPDKGFYKKDLQDPTALCIKHKEEERKLSKLVKLDSISTVEDQK